MQLLTDDIQLANPEVVKILHRLAREWFAETLADYNMWLGMFNPEDLRQDVADVKDYQTKERASLHQRPTSKERETLRRQIAHYIPAFKQEREVENHLHTLFKRANLEAGRIYLAKAEGNFTEAMVKDDIFHGIATDIVPPLPEDLGRSGYPRYQLPPDETPLPPTPPRSPIPTPRSETIAEALASYLADKEGRGRGSETVGIIRSTMATFQLINPTITHVHQITKLHIMEFPVKLGHIPLNLAKKPNLNKLSFAELLKVGKDVPKLGKRTRDKYTSNLRAFVRWLAFTDKLPPMQLPPHEKLDAHDKKPRRIPFSTEELTTIFHSSQYTGHLPDGDVQKRRHKEGGVITMDGTYWVPLIALYSGMRLGEIVQMYMTDIQTEDGVTIFNIEESDEDDDTPKPKKLKNTSSRRKVPVHPKLIELGFLDYVKSLKDKKRLRVFEDIQPAPNGSYSKNFSRTFTRYLIALGIKHKRISFHSFRHTFVTNGIKTTALPKGLVQALVGHSKDDSTTDIYTATYTMPELLEGIRKIQYPHEVTRKLKSYKSV